MKTLVNRRGALRTFGALAAGGAVSAFAGWTATSLSGRHGSRRTATRIAHITDVHVHPDGPSGHGLASVSPQAGGYEARLDDEQFDWLKADLQATPKTTPILILSHIPILAACALFDGDNEKSGDWVVPGAWMHLDARRLKSLFVEHP